MALKALSSLSSDEYENFLNSFDTVLTDCDGVLWVEDELLQGSPEVINEFKRMGKKVFFVTNNSTKTRSEFLDKFRSLGFNAKKEEIISTAYLTAEYLSSMNFNKKVYVVGSSGMAKELDNVGIRHTGVGPDVMTSNLTELVDNLKLDPEVGAVAVGLDVHFSVPKMIKAASYLERKGTIFLTANTDERYPLDADAVMPATGAFVAAIQTCAERKPIIVGKPGAYIRNYLVNKHKIDPSRTIMIGDRCNSDILLGKRCGFQTLLVLSGVTSLKQVKVWKDSKDKDKNELVPDYYTNKLGDLLPYVKNTWHY